MRLLTSFIILSFFSCNSSTKKQISFWETQKENFEYQNKSEFVSDSILRADYKTLKKMKHPLFDSIFSSNPVYLYSWQDRDKTKNEFTVIDDDGELGLKIFYFILDKSDKPISVTQIGGKGSEAFYWFETRSQFISKDTILNIGAITKFYDNIKRQMMEKTIGDSTFSYLIFDSTGKVTEKVFKEVKDLHFENE